MSGAKKTSSDVIEFTDIQLNKGNAYNNDTGGFLAPVSGLYLFSVQICGLNFEGSLSVAIYRSSKLNPIASLSTESNHPVFCKPVNSLSEIDKNETVYAVARNVDIYPDINDHFYGLLLNK